MKVISINLSEIPANKLKAVKTKKCKEGETHIFVSLCVADRDKPDNFGNDVSVWVNQTEEERAAKAEKIYIGSGKNYGATTPAANPFAPVADDTTPPVNTTAGNNDDCPI